MLRHFTTFLRALLAATLLLSVLALPAHADSVVSRSFGPDRISTAVEASENFRVSANDALLATAFAFPDALTAGALAHRMNAPVLLTGRDALPAIVADELARLGVTTVWILGGQGAISADVEQSLTDMGLRTRRLAGTSRYGTAREIVRAAGSSATGEVVLALGEHNDPDRAWPDAVASGALAATPDRIPTVLTRSDALPEETEEALEIIGATDVIILGDDSVIDDDVEAHLHMLGYATRRVTGDNRYETSVALASDALARFDSTEQPAVFASGRAFPDALSAGSLAASLGAPLLLVPPTEKLPGTSERFLRDHADRFSMGVVVGGPAAADEYVLAQLDAALQGQPSPAQPREEQPPAEPAAAPQPAPAEPAQPAASEEDNETFEGDASYYGPGLNGNQTANGETFDMYGMTAAHRTLPFDTIIRVTNLNNGRQVDLRINDRGPYADDRVLDVSYGAAQELQMMDDGVVPVRVEVLSSP